MAKIGIDPRARSFRVASGHGSSAYIDKGGLGVREAVRLARETSRRPGAFVCVHGPRMRPSEWRPGEAALHTDATLACFARGKRSEHTLGVEFHRRIRHGRASEARRLRSLGFTHR